MKKLMLSIESTVFAATCSEEKPEVTIDVCGRKNRRKVDENYEKNWRKLLWRMESLVYWERMIFIIRI